MPISEKILTEVGKAKATDAEKNLMIKILELEDKGVFRWQTEYETMIKKWIADNERDGK